MSKIFTPFYQPYTGSKRAYISGPMAGMPDLNWPAFDECAEILRRRGYQVCSPSDTDKWLGPLDHHEYLRFDFERVLEADMVVALPGWQESRGACSEIFVALRIATPVYEWKGDRLRWLVSLEEVQKAIGQLPDKYDE